MNPLFHILAMVIIDTILLIIAVSLAYYIWIKNMGVEIPDDRPPPVKNVQKHFQRRAFTFSSRSLEIIIEKYLQLLWKFDSSYWVKHCGIDAYIFLYFQRTAFKLFAIMSALSICISIPVNVFTSRDEDWSLENLFVRTTLNNKTMTEYTSWLHVAMLVGFSLFCFRTIFQMKDDIREEYKRQFLEKSRKQNTQWLKAHTVHVIGLPQRDRKGIMLAKYLNGFLKPIGGRVLGMIVQPDFESLFRLEIEKKEIEEIGNALQSRPMGCCFRCLLPDYLKDTERANEARLRIDNDIQKETETPFLAAGHAFVCFDSAISMQYCLQEFKRVSLLDALHMSCISCRDRCKACFGGARPRMTSTFGKYIEMDIETEHQTSPERYSDMKIEMERSNEPLDVNWYNMADGGGRGFYVCRRLILNVCAVLILIFLSTPTVIFSSIQNVVGKQRYISEWVNSLPYITLVQDFVTPLFIVALNQFLLLLIGYSAQLERHSTYSAYQYSVFNKSILYLGLNMVIIPALTLATAESLYSVVVKKNYDIAHILGDMYISDSGTFFVVLAIQCACFSAMGSLLRFGDVVSSYCSPWLAHFQRKYLTDSAPWRRKEDYMFNYGFFYAYYLSLFTIAILFSTTVPLITVAGAIFFGIVHIVDGYKILTVHLKEMESSGGLASRVLNVSLMSVFLYQFGMLCYFYMNEYYFETAVVALVILLSVVVNIAKTDVLFDPSLISSENFNLSTNILTKYLDRWRAEYSHPLYVKRMAAFTEEFDDDNRNREPEAKDKAEIKIESPSARVDPSPIPGDKHRLALENSNNALNNNSGSNSSQGQGKK